MKGTAMDHSNKKRSFKDILAGDRIGSKLNDTGRNYESNVEKKLMPIATPRRGGNVVVEVDIKDYKRRVAKLQYNVLGRLIIHGGN